MTTCSIGNCQRQADRVVYGQERCAEHGAELAAAMAAERQPDPQPEKRPRRKLLDVFKRVEPTITFERQEAATKPPLLIRFTRGANLGRRPFSGADVTVSVGDVVDCSELEAAGILSGAAISTAEDFAREVVNANKGELVHSGDKARLATKRPWGS